jgi:error-prone DNA polymerase
MHNHLIAQSLSDGLNGLADHDLEFRLPTGRGDEFAQGKPGRKHPCELTPTAVKSRNISIQICVSIL